MGDAVNHPSHYGDKDDPYEAIKVIEAWRLNFHLGNVLKYISRVGKKGDPITDLEKASWYLQREIERRRGGVLRHVERGCATCRYGDGEDCTNKGPCTLPSFSGWEPR